MKRIGFSQLRGAGVCTGLLLVLSGSGPCASHQAPDIQGLAARVRSSERAVWRPAADKLGSLAAENGAEERGRIWSLTLVNSLGMKFVDLPAGEFNLYQSFGNLPSDTFHRVQIERAFYLSVTEVTNSQYAALVPGHVPDAQYSPHLDCPVVGLRVRDTLEFCRRLSEREQAVYRLPTELEWEYACRAGTQGRFSFGEAPYYDYAWIDRSLGEAQPVALLKPNAWGFYDMHGNVAEYAGGVMIRGGAWNSAADSCTCYARFPIPLFQKQPFAEGPPLRKVVSFRIVREK